MKTITMSDEAYATICGLVAPSDDAIESYNRKTGSNETPGVNHEGITGPIEEIQRLFPREDFWAALSSVHPDDEDDAPLSYYPEAGF